jgi:hypothetical protein
MKDIFAKFAHDTEDPQINFDLGYYYQSVGHTASAISHYLRCAERTDDILLSYECLIRCYFCFDSQQNREITSKHMLKHAITIAPKRPEEYFLLARCYERKEEWYDCYLIACLALEFCNFDNKQLNTYLEYPGKYGLLFLKAISGWHWDKADQTKNILMDLYNNYTVDDIYRVSIKNNLKNLFNIELI